MNTLKLALVGLALVALAMPTDAAACRPGKSTPTAQEGPGTAGSITVYFVADICGETCNAFVYRESNGLDGLQRNDENRDDTCGGRFASDHLIL